MRLFSSYPNAAVQAAIRKYYMQHARPIAYVLAKTITDEEIVNDAVVHAFVQLARRPAILADEYHVRNFLYQAARWRAISGLRKKKLPTVAAERELFEPAAVEEKLRKADILLRLTPHLQRLPENQRKVLELRFFQELSYPEIATILRKRDGSLYDPDSIKSMESRALAKLRVWCSPKEFLLFGVLLLHRVENKNHTSYFIADDLRSEKNIHLN